MKNEKQEMCNKENRTKKDFYMHSNSQSRSYMNIREVTNNTSKSDLVNEENNGADKKNEQNQNKKNGNNRSDDNNNYDNDDNNNYDNNNNNDNDDNNNYDNNNNNNNDDTNNDNNINNNTEHEEVYNRIENIKSLIQAIKTNTHNNKNKNEIECNCSLELNMNSLTDIFKIYGLLVFCMRNHIKQYNFDKSLFLQIFLLEINLLGFFDKKPIKIADVLVEKKQQIEYEQDKFVCSYKTFINDEYIHINCEEDIDSLTYKYYKLFSKTTTNTSYYIDLLLFILLKRKESERFFNVYKNVQKTAYSHRFALLLSLQNECCRERNEILKEIKNDKSAKEEGILKEYVKKTKKGESNKNKNLRSVSENNLVLCECNKKLETLSVKSSISYQYIKEILDDESIFKNFQFLFDKEVVKEYDDERTDGGNDNNNNNNNINNNNWDDDNRIDIYSCIKDTYMLDKNSAILLKRVIDYIQDLIEIEVEIENWYEQKSIKQNWENNVKKWAMTRELDNIKIEKSMIKTCTQFKKYEEGWLIYISINKKDDDCLLKILNLCLCALKNTGKQVWIERICNLLQSCAEEKRKDICCTVTNNILDQIKCIHDEKTEILIVNIYKILEKFHLEENEEITSCLLKGFCTICCACKNTRTCAMCYKYAIKIYNKWKQSQESFFMFKKKSKHSDNIYSYVLGVCDENNDKNSFNAVCNDILKSDNEIGDNTLFRLEKYHKKCSCGRFNGCDGDKKYCKGLLRHCLKDLQ